MAGIFVIAVHLNVVHAIKFTIFRFDQVSRVLKTFCTFWKNCYDRKKEKNSFLHFLLDISKFQILEYRQIQAYSYSNTIIHIYIHSITTFKPEFGS